MSTSEAPASSDLSAKGHAVAQVLERHAPPAEGVELAGAIAAAVSEQLGQPGARVGRFSALRLLGGGALGIVYAGFDPDLGREVAIKLLGRRSDLGKLRLWREALALSGIDHPNVLSVYEVGWIDGTTYIATELAAHGTLADWLTTPRSLASILELFSQVGRGLAAVHRHGLVHRDVKPPNVFVAKDGRALVGDFGLVARAAARLQGRDAFSSGLGSAASTAGAPRAELTADGAAIGTPGYAAPEQWEGRPVDARADQYAFAVSLVRALWGTTMPLTDVATASPLPPSRSGERVPLELGAILRRALATAPEERYPEMLDLAAALERVGDRLLARRARRIGVMVLTLSMLGALASLLWAMR